MCQLVTTKNCVTGLCCFCDVSKCACLGVTDCIVINSKRNKETFFNQKKIKNKKFLQLFTETLELLILTIFFFFDLLQPVFCLPHASSSNPKLSNSMFICVPLCPPCHAVYEQTFKLLFFASFKM